MTSVVISFLGKGGKPGGRPEESSTASAGYRMAHYRFDDGQVIETPYFGLALAAHLRADQLIVLGTAGSMWDVFALDRAVHDDASMDAIVDLELEQAVRDGRVTPEMLEKLRPHISRAIGLDTRLALITTAATHDDQIAVLETIAEHVPDGADVTLDITHSFRHLPVLALVAARYLALVRGATIRSICYGALEMSAKTDDGTAVAPVVNLTGLVTMLDWVEALASYDRNGDYGALKTPLIADGLPEKIANLLGRAAFHERTTDSNRAKNDLSGVMASIAEHRGPLTRLFRGELDRRVAWFKRPTRHEREFELFERYLDREDFLRAAIYLQEASISAEVHRDRWPDTYEDRERALNALRAEGSAVSKVMRTLSDIRNALAHGPRAKEIPMEKKDKRSRDSSRAMDDPFTLGETLRECRRSLRTHLL